MKLFIGFTLLIVIVYAVGFVRYQKAINWMDRSFTTALKGIAMLTVVWAHASAKLGIGGIQFIAGVGVAIFLVCSGFGLEMSYQKNGLKKFWSKRILNVCVPFWVVELIGLLLTREFTIQSYVLDGL